MQRVTSRIGYALLVLLIIACSSAGRGNGQDLGLRAAPWAADERAVYDIIAEDGRTLGTAHFTIAKEESAWVITQTDEIGQLRQTATMRLDLSTLRPLSEEKRIRAPGTDATVYTTYRDGKLDIRAIVNEAERSATINVPANALDNDQLLMTLRALPLAEGLERKYAIIVAQNALKIDAIIRVTGKETVEVPAGTFEAWRVELEVAQGTQELWYGVEAPHPLVQYTQGPVRWVLTGR